MYLLKCLERFFLLFFKSEEGNVYEVIHDNVHCTMYNIEKEVRKSKKMQF